MSDAQMQQFRLSPQQRRLWLLGGEGTAFAAQAAILIQGDLDPGVLRQAAQRVVDSHEILRTAFLRQAWIKVPAQTVNPQGSLAWRESDPGEESLENGLQRWFERELEKPLAIETGSPLELTLSRLGNDRFLLLCRIPALCADSRSLRNLLDLIIQAYAGEDAGEPLQYSDFSEWQHEILAEEDASSAEGKAFWARQSLSDSPNMPEDSSAPFRPAFVSVDLPSHARLSQLAQQLGVPLQTLLLGFWLQILERSTGRRDPLVGIVSDGRKFDDLQAALGLFAKSLPVQVPFDSAWRLREALAEIRRVESETREWEEYAAWEPEKAGFPFAFELTRLPLSKSVGGVSFQPLIQYACSEPFQAKLYVCSSDDGGLRAQLQYDPSHLSHREAAAWAMRLESLAREALASPEAPLALYRALGDGEQHLMLVEVNDTTTEFPPIATVHELFERQAENTPDNPAVVCEGRTLTFSELDRFANQIAHYLRRAGVEPESRVALFLDRSPELIAALLGVLKAGGAYVPLDPAFPRERVRGMLEDAGVRLVLTRGELSRELPPVSGRIISLDREAAEIAHCDTRKPAVTVTGENLVYTLFTSGSTGRPKGVAIRHRNLINYVRGVSERLDLPSGATFASVSTFAADLGNTVVFPSLCNGGCLHIIPQEQASDPLALAEYCRAHPIDCLKIVPSHLEALLAGQETTAVLPQRRLVLGGEATRCALADRLREGVPADWLLNHYGPTEATVGSTTYRPGKSRFESDLSALPLGTPLPNQRVHVIDAALRPVPIGIAGELLLGGMGLARGYLDHPAATAERFIPDFLSGEPGARLYRTGDRVRFLPDGQLEFLGRVDHQVKIRGFRIELGEIEAVLAKDSSVRQAVLIVREDRPGDRRLVAYVVLRDGTPLQAPELRRSLKDRLPDYMIPSAFVSLRSLPLTANGKVDRAALPEPERARSEVESQVAPRNTTEEILAEIWKQVLGLSQVGTNDNFFELGGDSILVIQVIARAARHDLRFTPKQFFENQTIAELAAVAGSQAGVARTNPSSATGPFPLTPIQAWFMEQDFPCPEHWNQAVFLRLREHLAADPLRKALEILVAHHDALNLRFERTPEGWVQKAGTPGHPLLLVIDLDAIPSSLRKLALEAAAADVHRGLDLHSGPLLRAALFNLGDGEARLLLVAHHLVVDGVSWRILLDDLLAAYRDLRLGRPTTLPPTTTLFSEWAERLVRHVRSGALSAEVDYWRRTTQAGEPLPCDRSGGRNDVASERSIPLQLDPGETEALLQEAPAAYRTQINDLLLTALVQAFEPWTGSPSLLVDLEGHGREDLFPDVDLSRTVGWFTTHFPVFLDLTEVFEPGEAIRAVKEQLRRVPARGIGYGLLRYLSGAPELSQESGRSYPPQVCFNYLGQLDQALADDSPFAPASESSGAARNGRAARRCPIEVVSRVLEGRLQVSWRYSEALHERSTIESLAERYMAALRALIEHCRSREGGAVTPSDFPLASLDQTQLDKIASRIGLARIKS